MPWGTMAPSHRRADEIVEISVVIPTFEGGHRLRATLAALARCRVPEGGAEVVVVDDSSPQPVVLPRNLDLPFPARLQRLPTHSGRAGACNAGLRAARGRVALILDDDMTAAPNLLEVHAAAHPAEAPPRGLVGRIEPDPEFFTGRFGRFLAEEERRRHQRLAARREALSFTDCLTGHFSVPRRTLLAVGGYDEGFSRYGFEDIELAFRLERAGVGLVYTEATTTRHRSEFADFPAHCRRHMEAGAMARHFADRHRLAQVETFLRTEGMRWGKQRGWFRRTMALTHGLTRATPGPLRQALLALARAQVRMAERLAPTAVLHVGYHLVRDMHYAAGLAGRNR
ncbi:MAG: glycosyltransferase [Acidobacteriota bacterium]|nr:glycosyltransferase [Acidobacteriota bacterium]